MGSRVRGWIGPSNSLGSPEVCSLLLMLLLWINSRVLVDALVTIIWLSRIWRYFRDKQYVSRSRVCDKLSAW